MAPWRHKEGSGSGPKTAGELGHSQFGTALDQIIHANNADYDELKWIAIPGRWGGNYRGPQEFADTMAPLVWGSWLELNPGAEHPGREAVDRTALEIRTYAEKYGGSRPQNPFEIVTYLYLPDPHKHAFLVHTCVDDRPGLTVEQAVTDPEAIQTPVLEEFTTAALGTGVKATCHGVLDPRPGDLPGAQGMWVSVCYAFAVPGRQAVVTVRATDTDLAWMSAAAADLDEFVRCITLALADGTPVHVGPAPAG
jgi:hypothetical protein